MIRPAAAVKRSLIFVHRWLGVALSILFTLWFVSGIVLMYWGFPEVTTNDRLSRSPRLTEQQIKIAVEVAAATIGEEPGTQIELTTFDGRPVYRFSGPRGDGRTGAKPDCGALPPTLVFADDGSQPGSVDAGTVDRAAAVWTARALADVTKVSITEVDQWTVAGGLRNMRPLFKYSWPDGEQVYVNGATAEVVQYTTTASRFWAYLGAIPHWLYFTPLRQHQERWFATVVWSSLMGTIAALIGVIVAIWMYSPKKRYRQAGAPTSIPYRRWKRWHTIAGLLFGVATTTWAFSGLLSMGPFPLVDWFTELTVPVAANVSAAAQAGRGRRSAGAPRIEEALRGQRPPLLAYAAKPVSEAIGSIPDFEVKQVQYTSFGGEPVYIAADDHGGTRVVPVHGVPARQFDAARVMAMVREALGSDLSELRVMNEYDAYYIDRRGDRPLPVIYARLSDPVGTRYYIDLATARVVGTYSRRGWINRWLYHWPSFPRLPVALQAPSAMGHCCYLADAGRYGAVRDVSRAGMAGTCAEAGRVDAVADAAE